LRSAQFGQSLLSGTEEPATMNGDGEQRLEQVIQVGSEKNEQNVSSFVTAIGCGSVRLS